MSWTDVKHVMSMEPQWRDPLEFAVLAEIAKGYNPTFGFAWPSLGRIGKRFNRSARRVNEIVVVLEGRGLVIRLGPDPDVLGTRKGTQRFVPTWRVEAGVQQQLRAALDADDTATRGADVVDHPVENSAPDAETGATGRMEACDGPHGGHAMGRMGGMRPAACDQGTDLGTLEVLQGTEAADAAAQPRPGASTDQQKRADFLSGLEVLLAKGLVEPNGDGFRVTASGRNILDIDLRVAIERFVRPQVQLRLPTILATIRRTLVDEILRKRRAFLAAAPKDDNFKAVAKAASDVLANAALGARLVKGYDPERSEDVRDAVRLLCEKRHVDWGKPSYDLLHRAVSFAEVLPKVLAGEPRPREQAKQRQAGRRR